MFTFEIKNMSFKPLVTVVCTCHNQADFVIKSLNSVINQSYKNIELIIVDNASSDNSVQIIENWLLPYNDILFIKNKINSGNNTSFNEAVKVSKGDFLIDLAADDVLLNNCVEKQIKTFELNMDIAIVYGNAEIIDENDKHLYYYFDVNENLKIKNPLIKNLSYEKILENSANMNSVSGMMNATVFKTIGGYDNELYYEDLDYWLRISRNYQITFIDDILVQKRKLINSQLTKMYEKSDYSKKMNYSTYKILLKAFKMNVSKKEYKALLKKIHFNIIHNFKLFNFSLLIKLIWLKIKTELKIITR